MGETLEALHRLQKVEFELHRLREAIASRKRTIRGLERRLNLQNERIGAKQDEIRQLQLAADRAELDIRTHEAQIAKLREALNKAKTNKEYAAILTQLNTDKADNARLEDGVLRQLAQIDAARKELEELKESRDRDQARIAAETETATAFEDGRADELRRLQEERDQIAADLPASVLRAFERVAERHDGEAMAAIEQPDPRRQEYVCGGCHMGVPLDVINSLQARDDLQHCSTCGRILFLDQASGAPTR